MLASGRRSSYYIDGRLVTLSGEGAAMVAHAFLAVIDRDIVDAVAGLTIGADPIVASIAALSGLHGKPIDGVIVRKERKDHGTGGRLVGPWRPGLRVAIVDDTFTTGGSAIEAARAIEEEGGSVRGVYALIDREQGARATIEAAGYPFTALFTASQLLNSP